MKILNEEFSIEEKLNYLIGFTISQTIEVERNISFFICRFYSSNNYKLQERLYDFISEFNFNKKINVFLKILSSNKRRFNFSEKLKEEIESARKIRNYMAHEPFSFDKEEDNYTFVSNSGRLTKYRKEQIESHWKVCRYICSEVIKLSTKI